MINLSVAQLIIQSGLLHCYIATYMTVYWLLASSYGLNLFITNLPGDRFEMVILGCKTLVLDKQ